jgi:hypothetical protein
MTDYHVNGRPDRLLRREESIGQRIDETFLGRTDHMISRITYLSTENNPDVRQFALNASSGPLSEQNNIFVTKMVMEFERDPLVALGTDICRRIFYVREGKAVFYNHFGKSQVSGKVTTFMHTKGPNVPVLSDIAMSQEVGLSDDAEAILEAASLERECFTAIKSSVSLNDKIQENRREVERHIDYERSVFERALDTADNTTADDFVGTRNNKSAAHDSAKNSDYLTPYLRNVGDLSQITKEMVFSIRQTCLDALKARLAERASIIQTRLHEENSKLAKRQEQFQRAQREGDLSNEEYEKYCTEAMFRIQILEQRLATHEEAALRKYNDLDRKLAEDPRLKVAKIN